MSDERDEMLRDRYSRGMVGEVLVGLEQWRPFAKAGDRDAWEGLLDSEVNRLRKEYFIKQAEELAGQGWPVLSATDYMLYERTGNRRIFENQYFDRRRKLATLAMAECFEHQGRFVDEIINGVWAICEESTWCVPSHVCHYDADKRDQMLPRLDRHVVDLFASQTGFVLGELMYVLGDELDAVTPMVRTRVKKEVIERVVDSVMESEDFHWLRNNMNWNPWCSSNTLAAGYYLLEDQQRVADLTWKMMGSVDHFLAGQLSDGGCSEGPGYWGVAPGALVIMLEMLYTRSNGAINIYDEKLIAELGKYFTKVHLDGKWFATFADCPPLVRVRRAAVYRYGERIGNENMKNLALLSMRGWNVDGEVGDFVAEFSTGDRWHECLRDVWWIPGDAQPGAMVKNKAEWLPELQVMVARESSEAGQGLVVAAKGGHNKEHHNHNDVGQFILLSDGQPVVVDVGVGEYTKKTFSDERYEIWSIRSSGHNVPTVGGCEQCCGQEFAARDVVFTKEEEGVSLSIDLAGAYGEEAGVRKLVREVKLAGGELTVADAFEVEGKSVDVEICLFSPGDCELAGDGQVVMENNGKKVVMGIKGEGVEVSVEDWAIDDKRLMQAWGGRLKKIVVKSVLKGGSGGYVLRFKAEE